MAPRPAMNAMPPADRAMSRFSPEPSRGGAAANACRRVALSRPSIAARSAASNTSARTRSPTCSKVASRWRDRSTRDGLQLGVEGVAAGR